MRHLTTFFSYSTILACLSVIEWLFQVQKERPRSQNNCPITLFTRTFSFSLHHHWVVRHFGTLTDKLCVDFAWHISPLCQRAKRCHVGYFCKKTAVSALSKRMLPSCKNCALHVQSRSLQVKVIGLFILLAEFRAVMIKLGKYHVVTYFTSVKVWTLKHI